MHLNRRTLLALLSQASLARGSGAARSLRFRDILPARFPRSGIFRQQDHVVWCSSTVRSPDGMCHMFFSRWPLALGHRSWVSHSQIAHATATSPAGPFTFRSIALQARGVDFWDGHMAHNPCALFHDGSYYLYYTGNHGPATWRPDVAASEADWWIHRNHQRIGVAVAKSPYGPWQRFDKPLLDTPEYGNGIIGVPCVTPRPEGGFLLVYKTLAPGPGNFGGGVFHYAATSDSPLGPFKRHPVPLVDKSKIFHRHFDFHIDDHVEWFQGDRYYAIVKDHDAPYLTPNGKCLYQMESRNGLDWRISPDPLVTPFAVHWDDGSTEAFERLEMPKLFLEGGKPTVLYLAGLPSEDPTEHSFNIAIPLRS